MTSISTALFALICAFAALGALVSLLALIMMTAVVANGIAWRMEKKKRKGKMKND